MFDTSLLDREFAVLSRALRPGGILQVLHGAADPTAAERVTAAISTALRTHGFTAVTLSRGELGIGVSARAPAAKPAETALP